MHTNVSSKYATKCSATNHWNGDWSVVWIGVCVNDIEAVVYFMLLDKTDKILNFYEKLKKENLDEEI